MSNDPQLPPPPPGGWPGHVVQFWISKVAAAAIDIDAVPLRARAAGVPRARLEISRGHGGYSRINQVCITCAFPMAVYLVELLRVAAGPANEDTLIACAGAVKIILDELERSAADPRITDGMKPNRMG